MRLLMKKSESELPLKQRLSGGQQVEVLSMSLLILTVGIIVSETFSFNWTSICRSEKAEPLRHHDIILRKTFIPPNHRLVVILLHSTGVSKTKQIT